MTNTFSGLLIKKTLLALVVVIFAFTAVYVPQPNTRVAHAQRAQLAPQIKSIELQLWDNIRQTTIFGVSLQSMVTHGLQWSVTHILNGIAWAVAKAAILAMKKSIVRWINSGFKGSPAFIQDLGGFLTNIADETMGSLLLELGGPFSIVCSPFRLNVQIAISSAYNRTRDRNARRCTLSGALQNIQNFSTDMSQGGWDSWFRISQNPGQYTQLGAVLEAKVEFAATIVNVRGERYSLLDWAGGFMSSKVCSTVATPAGPRESCVITTPGSVIAAQLNETLGLGADSLVAADQINEVIGAFMEQLLVQAVTGVNGLLGTGGAKGYNAQYTNPIFNTELNTPGMEIPNNMQGRQLITDALVIENQYLANATALMQRYDSSYTNDPNIQQRADQAYSEASSALPITRSNILKLQTLLVRYDTAPTESDKLQVLYGYNAIAVNLNQKEAVKAKTDLWNFGLNGMLPKTSTTTLNAALERETLYLNLAQAANKVCAGLTSPVPTEEVVCSDALQVIQTSQFNITEIQGLLTYLDNPSENTDRNLVESNFLQLKQDLSTQIIIDKSRLDWQRVLGPLNR